MSKPKVTTSTLRLAGGAASQHVLSVPTTSSHHVQPTALRSQRATATGTLLTKNSSTLKAKTTSSSNSKQASTGTPNGKVTVTALDEADLKLMAQLQGHALAPTSAVESTVLVELLPSPMAELDNRKLALINAVSASLIGSPKLDDKADKTRHTLLCLAEVVVRQDPEFLLKLALCKYTLLCSATCQWSCASTSGRVLYHA